MDNYKNENLYELSGQVEAVVYRNNENGYCVIEVAGEDEMITAVGIMPELNIGENVKLIGAFTTHPNYGEQFSVSVCERCMPEDLDGILKYLSSGAVKGIGVSTATRLIKEFGVDTLKVLENEPQRVAKLKGISLEKANEFSDQLKQALGIRELMIYLSAYSISAQNAVKIWKKYGNLSQSIIEDNPFVLCEEDIGISFETADLISQSQNRDNSDQCRIRAALFYVLSHNRLNGHTCLPYDKLSITTAKLLNIDISVTESVLDKMIRDSTLILHNLDEKQFVFITSEFKQEQFIAARIKTLLNFPAAKINNIDKKISDIENQIGIEYDAYQKQAIKDAMTKGLLVLTGGPGTGKTTTLNAIIKILKQSGQKVMLCAPTGRAANRMSELTGEDASTIHRLLEVTFDNNEKPYFKKNERHPLNCDALIVDEMSMVDSALFESLIRALPLSCRLILVGDTNQLPSIDCGNVLLDIISSNIIPVVALNKIFRQSGKSLIVINAHKIVNGEMPDLSNKGSDFFFIPIKNREQIAYNIADICTRRLKNTYDYNLINNIQVLSPTKKGLLGTYELNCRLQEIVNPKSKNKAKRETAVGYYTLREGDKVMQTKNNYNITWKKGNGEEGNGVYNGDIGVLTEVNSASQIFKVRFDDKVAEYDGSSISDLELAYACTVHKSQGNEFDCVVMPMFNTSPQLMYRNLLYTAVTRAKKMLIIVGNDESLNAMINNNRKILRYTGLKYFLIDN